MNADKVKPEPSPYEQLREALAQHSPTARCLAVVDGPNKGKHPAASELEFWHMPDPAPGRLVIIQRWRNAGAGGWDFYLQGAENRTANAIREVIGRPVPELPHQPHGAGLCPVCGHYGGLGALALLLALSLFPRVVFGINSWTPITARLESPTEASPTRFFQNVQIEDFSVGKNLFSGAFFHRLEVGIRDSKFFGHGGPLPARWNNFSRSRFGFLTLAVFGGFSGGHNSTKYFSDYGRSFPVIGKRQFYTDIPSGFAFGTISSYFIDENLMNAQIGSYSRQEQICTFNIGQCISTFLGGVGGRLSSAGGASSNAIEQHGTDGQYAVEQNEKEIEPKSEPRIRRLFFAVFGILGCFILAFLGGNYLDNKRRTLGAALIICAFVLALGSLGLAALSSFRWSWSWFL